MNARLDTETFLSASSASATSQDRTARLATRREEPVAVQIEQENVAARKMWRETTAITVSPTRLGYPYETRWAAAGVTVTD